MTDSGRELFERHAWAEAYAQLAAAGQTTPLEPTDLERLAIAAYLLGRHEESAEVWARAHQKYLDRNLPEAAARCAFWLAYGLLDRGEIARGSGWLARARRLVVEGSRDCVEQGYLLLPLGIEAIGKGDHALAQQAFRRAAEIGDRFRDRDLVALARHGEGRALIRSGMTAQGVELLDEAMVAVTAGEVSPMVAGDVYCGVLSGCQEIFDWRRAREWTAALEHWCATQPDLVAYRGQCMVRRAEILRLHGDWAEAMQEALRACERLTSPPGQPGVGAAFYELAELYRVQGRFGEAETAYRRVRESGRNPQPGLSLLRLGQGRIEEAVGEIRKALADADEPRARARLLPAYVDIALESADVGAARAVSDELSAIARQLEAPYLEAVADHAAGAVLLAEGDCAGALAALRRALAAWQDTGAAYETARTRGLLALACQRQGDDEAAESELEWARSTFRRLGARPDLARLRRLFLPAPAGGGLTPRELQVLRLVAGGKTNRAIAAELGISEKTVARHVSNIFVKLGLSSRAAATAHAYRHDLV